MLKYPNSQYYSQRTFPSTPPSTNSLIYLYDSNSYPQEAQMNAYSPLYFPKSGPVPLQKSLPYQSVGNYQKPPTLSPTHGYYNQYMAPLENERSPIAYYAKRPSYYPAYSYRKTELMDPNFPYVSNTANLDVDQYFASSLSSPSRENTTSNLSDELLDATSYTSPLDNSQIHIKLSNGAGRPPKRNSSAKSYHNRTLDNEVFDEKDEKLLLELAPKYKNDWKKISKRMFRLHNKKFGLNFLRIKYKELADDNVKKRVRFTHKEDLMIAKYSSIYGHDWTKIAYYFSNRTPIMLKNRYYHMKKKNILDKLVKEVEELEKENVNVDKLGEEQKETVQVFSNNEERLTSKKISLPVGSYEMSDMNTEIQLCDTVTPATESQDYDQELFDQTQSYGQTSSDDQPMIFEENAIYEHPSTIEQAQIDENQEPQPISLLEKIEKGNDAPTEEPNNYQYKGIGLDELPRFSFYSEDDDDWFTRGLNRRVSEVNF